MNTGLESDTLTDKMLPALFSSLLSCNEISEWTQQFSGSESETLTKSCFLLLLECGIRALALPKLFCTVKSYKETSILLCLCARNESGIEAIIVYCPCFFFTAGDTQAEGNGKMNGSSSSSTVLPPQLKEHERPPLLVNCEVSLLHGKMLLIPRKYCGWDAQSQPEIAGNFSQAFILCPCTPGEVSFLTSCLTTGPPSSLLLQSQKSVVVWLLSLCISYLKLLILLLSLTLPSFMHPPSYSRWWSTLTCLQRCSPSTSTRITLTSMRILMTLYVCMCHFSLCDLPTKTWGQTLREPVKFTAEWPAIKVRSFLGVGRCRGFHGLFHIEYIYQERVDLKKASTHFFFWLFHYEADSWTQHSSHQHLNLTNLYLSYHYLLHNATRGEEMTDFCWDIKHNNIQCAY